MAIIATVLPEIALVAAAILAKVLTVATAILTEIAGVFTPFLAEFATVDLALTKVLAIFTAVAAQLTAILAPFLTELATIFVAFLAEFLSRQLRGSTPVLVGHGCRPFLATFDALRLPLLPDLLPLLDRCRICATFGLPCLTGGVGLPLGLPSLTCRRSLALCLTGFSRLLALLDLFGARAAIAALTAVLRDGRNRDQ